MDESKLTEKQIKRIQEKIDRAEKSEFTKRKTREEML